MFKRADCIALVLPAVALLGPLGCDPFVEPGAQVVVFSTHHATPEGGVFPDRGGDGRPRKFLNDLGWEVTLLDAYVTIEAISLVDCGGTEHVLDMFWGPCPEDLRAEDLDVLTVAGKKLPAGDYCELLVQYGPYETPVINENTPTLHRIPSSSEVLGSSVYLAGGARIEQTGNALDFNLRATGSTVTSLDLSGLEGGSPLNIADKENFPVELTISKTYDRFFDGIAFDAYDVATLEARLLDSLDGDTRINRGTTVSIDPQ